MDYKTPKVFYDLQERLDITISPLQITLGAGFERTEGLPGGLLKALEVSLSMKANSP